MSADHAAAEECVVAMSPGAAVKQQLSCALSSRPCGLAGSGAGHDCGVPLAGADKVAFDSDRAVFDASGDGA